MTQDRAIPQFKATASEFKETDALYLQARISALLRSESNLHITCANYNDPNDYRTPMYQERLEEARNKIARVNTALQVLAEILA